MCSEAHLQELTQLASVMGAIDNGCAILLVILCLCSQLASIELDNVCSAINSILAVCIHSHW